MTFACDFRNVLQLVGRSGLGADARQVSLFEWIDRLDGVLMS